jgi:hypothetical protein
MTPQAQTQIAAARLLHPSPSGEGLGEGPVDATDAGEKAW